MAKKRFEVDYQQTSGLLNYFQIVVDKETGVNYLMAKTGYGAGLTPLLDDKGNVVVTK